MFDDFENVSKSDYEIACAPQGVCVCMCKKEEGESGRGCFWLPNVVFEAKFIIKSLVLFRKWQCRRTFVRTGDKKKEESLKDLDSDLLYQEHG